MLIVMCSTITCLYFLGRIWKFSKRGSSDKVRKEKWPIYCFREATRWSASKWIAIIDLDRSEYYT